MSGPFHGKFRGVVADNQDPLQILRIRALVPDVLGEDPSGWALPCMPFGGPGSGLFGLPVVGANVWVEFEHGDPEYPVWTGVFWTDATDLPSELLASPPDIVMLVTPGGHAVTVSDVQGKGGFSVTTADGCAVELTSSGVTLDNGQGATVTMQGPTVSVNDGALDVT